MLPQSGTGAATLNFDTLGAKAVKLTDGSSSRGADITEGLHSALWPHLAKPWGGTGVTNTVIVCPKDATCAYAWRSIY